MSFRVNPSLDVDALAARYASVGHVVIDGLIEEEAADALHQYLRSRDDWRRVILSGERVIEVDRDGWAGIAPEKRMELENAIYAAARHAFQFRYEAIRVPDALEDRARAVNPLTEFANFMSSDRVVSLLRVVTGQDDLAFCDAQGTAYAPGDFLTGHDDEVPGKNRRAAYVFGLSANWRPEWGGLLLFHRRDGLVDGVVPSFNRLTLFKVPQTHSVSEVTRSAPKRRYSVTGWARAKSS